MVNEFKEKASKADGFVFGAPVHYASNNGNMASFMDRIFYSNRERERYRLKPAACVAVCRRAGAEPALERMSKYFSLAEMPLIFRSRPCVSSMEKSPALSLTLRVLS